MLLDDWREIAAKAWSVRLIILAGVLSGAEAALPIMRETLEPLGLIPPGAFAILSAVVSAGALVARVLAQPDKAEVKK